MADVAVDPQNTNPKELYGQGVRAYVVQDYESAVQALSKAAELFTAEYQNELHESLGEVYLYYGKSLLELSRKESGPFGEAVLKNIKEDSDSDFEEEVTEEEPTKTNGNTEVGDAKSEEQQAGTSSKSEGGVEEEEELTDLQVAWEVLELAKRIFQTNESQRKNLAETLICLGEVSLESGNFPSSIEDITQGLEIQKKCFGKDSRAVAETLYKLGGALSINGQIDEAIKCFCESSEYLKNRIDGLKEDKEKLEENEEEIEELDALIPEIAEKIEDMKSLKQEIGEKVTNGAEKSPPAQPTSPTAKPASDISHLVKRKRKDDDASEENPNKKPSP